MLQPTVEQIVRMIEYLDRNSFVVPHHNLQLPIEADGDNYRSEKVFRFCMNGTLTYQGWGGISGRRMDITKSGIPPTQRWIDRAYIYLAGEVRAKVRVKSENTGLPMRKAAFLLLKFNKLEFVNFDEVF